MDINSKNIVFVGTAHPYRGGIAAFNEMLARSLQKMGNNVRIDTFTLQYPYFLFPGETQYTTSAAPEDLKICRSVNSINPINWISNGLRIKKEKPDVLFLRYWTPYLSPVLGTIARIVRSNGHTKVITLADNIVPHEPKFWDNFLTKYYVGSSDYFVCMSNEVKQDLKRFTSKEVSVTPHPLYNNYGESVTREEAATKLGLSPDNRYAMFFGFIRNYKGLDILLEAWSIYKSKSADKNTRLIVAGEFYCDSKPYYDLISLYGLEDSVIMMDRFVEDSEVKYLFSLSDMVVQPYKSATQSGVTQIAYHFEVPMIVTNVGGLPEIVPHMEAGYVTPVEPKEIAKAIASLFDPSVQKSFRVKMVKYKELFSWERMCETILTFVK